jgi:tripeptide aminopeptidase
VPTIGFISHFDTTPDFTGKDVKPQIIPNYDGGDIILNEEQNIVLSPSYFKDLLLYKGQTLITTNGLTLLGADDKAGITEIVTAMEYLVNNPNKIVEMGKASRLKAENEFNIDFVIKTHLEIYNQYK